MAAGKDALEKGQRTFTYILKKKREILFLSCFSVLCHEFFKIFIYRDNLLQINVPQKQINRNRGGLINMSVRSVQRCDYEDTAINCNYVSLIK